MLIAWRQVRESVSIETLIVMFPKSAVAKFAGVGKLTLIIGGGVRPDCALLWLCDTHANRALKPEAEE